MRLIDADALIDAFNESDRDSALADYVFNTVIKVIYMSPTIDAVEVRHGRWNYIADGVWQCNECHWLSNVAYAFCPNCGARMDGDEPTVVQIVPKLKTSHRKGASDE